MLGSVHNSCMFFLAMLVRGFVSHEFRYPAPIFFSQEDLIRGGNKQMKGDRIIIASERSARLKFVEDLVHLWVWNSKAEVRLTVRAT